MINNLTNQKEQYDIAYFLYIMDMVTPIPQNFITQIINGSSGVGVIYIFSWRVLKQNAVTSMAIGVLLITTNILVESTITPLQSIIARYFSITNNANSVIAGVLILSVTYAFLYYFSARYNLKSSSNSYYLLILVIPMLFIDIVMGILIETKYFRLGVNYSQLAHTVSKQNYEFLGLSVLAFICVCGLLYAYEKVILSFESENQ